MARSRHARRRLRRGRARCKTHTYGPGRASGGGLVRFVCSACGAVSIDLTAADAPEGTGSLFEATRGPIERP